MTVFFFLSSSVRSTEHPQYGRRKTGRKIVKKKCEKRGDRGNMTKEGPREKKGREKGRHEERAGVLCIFCWPRLCGLDSSVFHSRGSSSLHLVSFAISHPRTDMSVEVCENNHGREVSPNEDDTVLSCRWPSMGESTCRSPF